LKLTAQDLYSLGIIERIFTEPAEFSALYAELKGAFISALREYTTLDGKAIADIRYHKFRSIGGQPL
jgi:acetyl-CoA carboxylase alpha subunit